MHINFIMIAVIAFLVSNFFTGFIAYNKGWDAREAKYNQEALEQSNREQEAAREVTKQSQKQKSKIRQSERISRDTLRSNSQINDHRVSPYFDAGSHELWRRYNENNK